jgi:WD40 repeat protein
MVETGGSAVASGSAATGVRLFIVHAAEDAWFVDGFLIAAVGLPDTDVLVSSKLAPGAAIAGEIERGAASAITVVVTSPAFVASPWAQLANQLAAYASVEAAGTGTATLIPALLADCELPLLARFRVPLDFRNPNRDHWETEVAKLRTRLAAPPHVAVEVPCPYPGMRPFATEDAAQFYGRDKEIAELLGRLRDGQRELYVIGPSGSGKSSLVAAGLIPSLRRSPERAGSAFVVVQLRPGADPVARLAGALAATPEERADPALRGLAAAVARLLADHPDHRLLIFVDQLEELFTLATGPDRAGLIAAMRALRADPRVAFVLTLRADFYAQLMESALWADLDGKLSRLDVGPLRGDALRAAIEAPARARGVYFEPVLMERLLRDVADEPGALPLLQDMLLELWQRRARGVLRLAEYDAMSDGVRTGLAVTMARRADGALNELSAARRDIARRVLLRLVRFGDGVATTRRQQPRAALATAGEHAEELDLVIQHLADRRLITTGGGDAADPSARIDLAHEVLLSAWPVLGEWIRSRRQDEQRRRELEDRTAEWVKHGRGTSRLLDADEVRDARGWLTADLARDLGISDDLHQLIAHSEAALAAQRADAVAHRARLRRWITTALATLTAAVVAVSVLAAIATQQSRTARQQTLIAETRSQETRRQATIAETQSREARHQAEVAAVQSQRARQLLGRTCVAQAHALLADRQLAQALPLLLAAREAGIDDVPIRALFRWAAQSAPSVVLTHEDTVNSVAWSPDGQRVATASNDHTARMWDARSGQPAMPPIIHEVPVRTVAWSPDGAQLVTASDDHNARVWSARDGHPVTPPLVHAGFLYGVAWRPDGRQIATADDAPAQLVWDAVTGQPVTRFAQQTGTTSDTVWSPDGTRLATTNNATVRVWDAVTGRAVSPLLAHADLVNEVAWSPDGTRLATGSDDNTARVWDAASGRAVTPPLRHAKHVEAVAWSPDGTRVATASADGTARVWDAISGHPMGAPLVHHDSVHAVAWSPDGRRIATASDDRTAQIWDAGSGAAVRPPLVLVHADVVTAVAWSPDGSQVATVSGDTAQLWTVRETAPLAIQHQAAVNAVAWSPDGTRVATAGDDQTARVWDAVTGLPRTLPFAHHARVVAVAWSPDGQRLATVSGGAAQIWDPVHGREMTPPFGTENAVRALAWNPDGRRLATAGGGVAGLWDAASLRAVAWSPGGRLVATGHDEGAVQVWDVASGKPVTPLVVYESVIRALAWSPDGTRLATASEDSTARVWDVASDLAVTPPLRHTAQVVESVAWRPDGLRIATASGNQARVWDATSGDPVTPPLGHTAVVRAVAWSPDGTRLATASADNMARVWDAVTGQEVAPPLLHQDAVGAIAWSPDGRWLVTGSADHTARIWDVSWNTGTLDEWRAAVERGRYWLNSEGVPVERPAGSP